MLIVFMLMFSPKVIEKQGHEIYVCRHWMYCFLSTLPPHVTLHLVFLIRLSFIINERIMHPALNQILWPTLWILNLCIVYMNDDLGSVVVRKALRVAEDWYSVPFLKRSTGQQVLLTLAAHGRKLLTEFTRSMFFKAPWATKYLSNVPFRDTCKKKMLLLIIKTSKYLY